MFGTQKLDFGANDILSVRNSLGRQSMEEQTAPASPNRILMASNSPERPSLSNDQAENKSHEPGPWRTLELSRVRCVYPSSI